MPKLGMEAIRRRQVIDAVLHILQTQGWKDLTIREVSDVAGVSTGIVTHYFGSKRSMTIDSLIEANVRFERSLREAIRRHASPALRLHAVVDHLLPRQEVRVPDWSFWLCIWGRMPFDKVIKAEMQALNRRLIELIAEIVEEGKRNGAFRTEASTDDVATQMVTQICGLGQFAVMMPEDMPPERIRKYLLHFLERELGLSSGPQLVARSAEPAKRSS